MPLGCGFLMLMAAAAMALCFVSGFARLERDWIYNIGQDVLGILICAALYYGCMNGKGKQEEITYLFVAMLSSNGFALFLDELAWLVQGVPSLRIWNVIVNVLFYANGPVVVYQYWLYVQRSLSLDSRLMQMAAKALRILLIPASLACWVNLFVPLYFSVDELGVYRRGALYPLTYIYLGVAMTFMIIGMVQSNAPRTQKRVVI